MQLHAIRSGDVSLTLADGAVWMNRVKASLFTGGIDPGRLVARFDSLASTKGTLAHNRKRKELTDERAALRERLKVLQSERSDILARQEQVETLRRRIAELDDQRRQNDEERRRQEEALEAERQIRRKRELRSIAQLTRQEADARAQVAKLSAFGRQDLAVLDELQRAVDSARNALEIARHDAEAKRAQREAAAAAASAAAAKADTLQAQSHVAGELVDSLNRLRRDPPTVRKAEVSPLFVVPAVVVVLAGIAGALLLGDPLYRLGAAFAGVTVGLLVFFLVGFRMRTVPDESALSRELSSIRDTWRNRISDGPALEATTVDGMVDELQRRRIAADQAETRRAELREAFALREQEERAAQETITTRRQAAADAEAALHGWLTPRGLRSRDDLVELLSRKQTAAQEVQRLTEKLAELVSRYEVGDVAELRAYADRHLKALDEQGVPNQGRSDAELRRLQAKIGQLQAQLQQVQETRARLAAQLHREQGEITGSLGKLPQNIADAERHLGTVEKRLAELRLEREAAAIARDIFQAIDEDSEAVLVSLAREISTLFGELVPEVREVRIPSLTENALSLQDAGGTVRRIPHLSHGTRHAFALAARLILAERAAEEPGVLVLDEPFHALDHGRTRNALGLLRRFQERNGFQLVLFTKDEALVAATEEEFPEAVTNRL
jgi:DNA repair exonuclease SbcCD ATPase subunit